MYSTQHYH